MGLFKKLFLTVVLVSACSFVNRDKGAVLDPEENGLSVFELDSEDSFYNIIDAIKEELEADSSFSCEIEFLENNKILVSKKKDNEEPRNYFAAISSSDIYDISYIVKVLASHKTIELAKYKSELKSRGKNVDRVHPLRFLQVICLDPELSNCALAIKSNGGFVWQRFIDGIVTSFKDETKLSNMPPEYIADFANIIRIDMNLILPAYYSQKWVELVSIVIDAVNNKEDSDRYKW